MVAQTSRSVDYLSLWPDSSRFKAASEERRRGVCYTMPGLKSEKLLNVPTSDEAKQCYDNHFCRPDAELNIRGLKMLISSCHLEVAVNATTVLLSQMGQGEGKAGKPSTITPLHAEIWGIRFQLLMALKLYSQLVEELQPFGELDAPDLCYQYYSESNEKNRISHSLLNASDSRRGSTFYSFPWKAVEQVKRLELDVNKAIMLVCSLNATEDTISAWHQRLTVVQKMYARVLFFLGEYVLSLRTFYTILNTSFVANPTALLEAMFRMALSVGDEKAANKMLECVSKSTSTQPCLLKAFRSLFLGAFPHAQEYLQRISRSSGENDTTLNSVAICLLYNGKVSDAVEVYAKFIQNSSEPLYANLKAMSELGCSAATKNVLLNEFSKRKTV